MIFQKQKFQNRSDIKSDIFFKPKFNLNNINLQNQRKVNNSENYNIPAFVNKKINAFVPNGDSTGDKNETETKTEKTEPTTISSSNCEPQAVSYDDFLKATGNIDDAFGITILSSNHVIFPALILKKGVLQKTDASMQVDSFYLKTQTFKDKGIVILPDDGDAQNNYCPKGRYDRYWLITSSGADKIKEGEQEHCNDFTLAFNLSLIKFRDTVNASAGKKFASVGAAKIYLEKKTKVHPDNWENNFWCLAKKTKERDSLNWHLPKFINPRINKSCDKALVYISGTSLPEIGKHPSEEIIKDCDPKKDK